VSAAVQYGRVYCSALWCVSMHECRQEKGHALNAPCMCDLSSVVSSSCQTSLLQKDLLFIYCKTMHQAATHCNTRRQSALLPRHGRTATHCTTHSDRMHQTVTHCTTLQHIATHSHLKPANKFAMSSSYRSLLFEYCSTVQPTSKHCNALHHNTTHYNTLQHIATRCNTLQHTHT